MSSVRQTCSYAHENHETASDGRYDFIVHCGGGTRRGMSRGLDATGEVLTDDGGVGDALDDCAHAVCGADVVEGRGLNASGECRSQAIGRS